MATAETDTAPSKHEPRGHEKTVKPQERTSDQGGGPLDHFFGVASNEAQTRGAAQLLRSPLLSDPANGSVRAVACKSVQHSHGNRFAQRAISGRHRSRSETRERATPARSTSVPIEEPARLPQRQPASSPTFANSDLQRHDPIPSGSGEPMEAQTRQFMESRFGADFGEVRVHTDDRAAESAESLGAAAYASGRDIYFAAGKYAPHTPDGQRLVAHELVHTIQQRTAAPPPDVTARSTQGIVEPASNDPSKGEPAILAPDNPYYEHEADRVADSVMRMPDPGPEGSKEKTTPAKPLAKQISPLWHRSTEGMGSGSTYSLQRQEAKTPSPDKPDERARAQAALQAIGLTLSDDDLSQLIKQFTSGDIVLSPVQLTLYGRAGGIAAAAKLQANQVLGSNYTPKTATYVFETGAGRAILVVGEGGVSRLFDAGNITGRTAAGVNYLVQAGLAKTPGMIKISHTDSDHLTDLQAVVEGCGMPKPLVEITKQQLADPNLTKFATSRLLAVRSNIVEIDVTGQGLHVHREISGALQYTDFRWAPAHAAVAAGGGTAKQRAGVVNAGSPVAIIRDLMTGEVRVYTADSEPTTVMKMFQYIHPSAMPYLFGEGQLKEFELPHHGGASTETRRTEAALNYIRLLRLAYEASDGTTTFFTQTQADRLEAETSHARVLHAAGFPIVTALLGSQPGGPNILSIKGGVADTLRLSPEEQSEVNTKVQPGESALMNARKVGAAVAKLRMALEIQLEAAQMGSPGVAKGIAETLEKLEVEDKARSEAVGEWWSSLERSVTASGGFNKDLDVRSCVEALAKIGTAPTMTAERLAEYERTTEFNTTMMDASGRVAELALGMSDALLKQDWGRMESLKGRQGEAYRDAVAVMGGAKVDETVLSAWKTEVGKLQQIQGELLEMGYEVAKAKAENRLATASMGALANQMNAEAMIARASEGQGGIPRTSSGNINQSARVGAGAMAAIEVIRITLDLWHNIQAGLAAAEVRAIKRQLRGWNKMQWWVKIGATPQVEVVDDDDNPLSPRLTDVPTIYRVMANEKVDDSYKLPDRPRIVVTGLTKQDQMMAATSLFLRVSNLDEWHGAVNDARGQQDEEGRPQIGVDDTGAQWGVYVWDFKKKDYVQQVDPEVSAFLENVYKTCFENSDAELKEKAAKGDKQVATVKLTGYFFKTRDCWIYPLRGGIHKSKFPFEPSLLLPKKLPADDLVVATAADAQTYDFLRQFLWLREQRDAQAASQSVTIHYEPNTEGRCYVDVGDLEMRAPPPPASPGTVGTPGTDAPVQRQVSAGKPQSAGVIPDGSGEPLGESTRTSMESRLGADFADVRVHTDLPANDSAESLGANAFTAGRDIYFASGQYSPASSDGQRLLAHELTHTIQQRQGREPAIVSQDNQHGLPVGSPEDPLEHEAELTADKVMRSDSDANSPGINGSPDSNVNSVRRTIQRAPAGGFPGDQPVSDAPPFVDEATLVEPGKSDHDVTVVAPFLVDPSRISEREQLHFKVHTPVFKRDDITLYAVPITNLQLPKVPASASGTVTTGAPGTVTSATSQTIASNPQIPVGSVVQTLDGVKLEVLASTREHVITAKYTKFAVGAASTSALRLMDQTVVIIDAGINNRGLGTSYRALADATMQRLADFIGDDPIRDLLISHAHKDHISLVSEIMQRFRVDTIRINDIQKRWPGYKALRKVIVELQQRRYRQTEARVRQEIESERSAWEEANKGPDAGIMQERWEKHATEKLQKRMAEIPRLKERTLIPSKGGVLDIVDVDVRTGETSAPDEFQAEDPLEIRETMREPTDPDALKRNRNTKEKDVDPNASAYLIQLPGGLRFLVLPDIRAGDMEALTKRFADEVKNLHLKEPVTVQIWDATHHMQTGWSGQGIKATQLRKIVDFLSTFQTKHGADAVVVSAQADFSRPGAKTLVDPVNIWLLRSLGFEVYLATSARDVTFFEITTTQGTKLAGTPATSAPGSAPGELSIKRAKMALDELHADKQTREAALADETDPTRQKYIREAIVEIDAKITEIDTALNDYIRAGHEALAAPHGSQTTQSLAQAPEPAIAERRTLDTILERWNFDRPVTTDLHLTEMAMVVLKQEVRLANPEPGSPAARALDLRTVRSRINELGAEIARGGAPETVTAELFTQLEKYKSILKAELHPTDPNQKPLPAGVSRTLLEDDLKSVEAKIETLEGARKAGSIERAIGSGEIIETHVVAVQKPAQESTASRATRGAIDVAGKGLGAVMVIQTIRGEGQLMRRWEEGRANNTEMVLGTTHNLGATAVGVKMVRGVHVGNGVFVVLSLLDVGAAIAHDYESDEQRDVEVSYAIISNALNLGLMVVGQALMKVPNPLAQIAGFLIAFVGRPILEALGVHEWLERKYGFNPSDVIQVYQTLRKLVDKYSIIAGSIMLADRTAAGLEDLSVSDPSALREQARVTARDHRIAAIPLEREILGEFKTAYDDAKGNYAGLKVLDQYREQFITLQRQANPHGEEMAAWQEVYGAERAQLKQQDAEAQKDESPGQKRFNIPTPLAVAETANPEPQPTAKLIEKTFADIESGMNLDSMSADDIREMPQWDRLRKALFSLLVEVSKGSSELDNKEIRKKESEARLMLENARYRLDPRAQGEFRSKGLFSPNSPAKAVYEEELEKYERWLALANERYIETAMKLCGAPLLAQSVGETQISAESRLVTNKLSAESMIGMVEVAITRYKATVESMMAPPESLIVTLFTNSADAQTYEQFINDHPYYGAELKRVEMVDATIDALIDQAWSIARPDPVVKEESDEVKRLKAAVAKKKQANDVRFHQRGIIFSSELKGLAAQVKEAEITELASLLGEKPGTQQLSQEEIAAIQSDQMESIREGMVPPISNRLHQIPALRRKDANGNLTNIYQLYGPIIVGSGGKWIETQKHKYIRNEDNVVVGAIGEGESWEATVDYPERPTVRVIPLNDAAVKAFERYEWKDVLPSALEPLNEKQLEAMRNK